jgi:hypothetical protein
LLLQSSFPLRGERRKKRGVVGFFLLEERPAPLSRRNKLRSEASRPSSPFPPKDSLLASLPSGRESFAPPHSKGKLNPKGQREGHRGTPFMTIALLDYLSYKQYNIQSMNIELVFQLGSLLLVVAAGPLVVVLLSLRGGNL